MYSASLPGFEQRGQQTENQPLTEFQCIFEKKHTIDNRGLARKLQTVPYSPQNLKENFGALISLLTCKCSSCCKQDVVWRGCLRAADTA